MAWHDCCQYCPKCTGKEKSAVAVDNEGEEFTYDVEGENPDNQPEMAYTREETRELVHSLMDSLSEEQRLCILMFHIEGASILEIAEVMDCSENTVKSRLNYGRKNLKVKAEKRLQALQCGSGCTSCIPASFRQRGYGSRKYRQNFRQFQRRNCKICGKCSQELHLKATTVVRSAEATQSIRRPHISQDSANCQKALL